MLLRGFAVGDRHASAAKRMKSLQQLPASSSTRSRSVMWLCCAAQPLADDDPDPFTPSMGLQVVNRMPQGLAHDSDSQPVLSPKDPSAATGAAAAVQGLIQQQQYQQQQEQQVVVINADTSPRPGPPSTSPLAAAAAAAVAGDTSSNNDWQQQQQQQHQHLLLACQSRLSVDVHTLASGRSSTAADAVANAANSLDRVSSSLVPLNQDSLSTTTAAAAAATAACLGMLGHPPATTMHSLPADQGSEHHDSKGSSSEIHSDTQLHSKALYSSSSSASSILQPQPLASSLDSSTLEPQDASILPREPAASMLPQEPAASILPQEPAASILPSTATSSSDADRKQQLLNPLTARNPLWQQDYQAGDHEQQQQQLLLSGEQQQQQQQQQQQRGLQHCSIAPDGCSCQATTASVASWTDILPPLPPLPAAAADNSLPGLANCAQAAFDLPVAADDSPLALPPGLAAKLRKLESGLSFRMLQPELSISIRASDSLPAQSTAGVSDSVTTAGVSDSVTTAGVSDHSVTTAPVSETHSGPTSGPVSRRSTAGLSPGVLPLGGLNPAGPDEQLPASIPEHNSVTGPCGEAVPTAAAVAAAFEGDAAAVQGLVDAAAAAVPVPKPHHSRSKSAGVLSTPSAQPTGHTAAAAARASTPTAAGAAVSATGGVAAITATGAPGDASSSMRPVPRTLSVSSSPFAQMDLQQAVTASLLRVTSMQPPRAAAAASPAAPAAARQSRRSVDAAMLGTASSAAALRPSSSSRSMPYGLTAQQLQQQNSQASHSLPGQNSLRPSMTSRLSWASTVTVFEPQSHIFTLLDSGSVTHSVSNNVSDEADDNATRILRPSKSMSSLPSFKGSTSSSGGSVSGLKRGKGLFSLPRVKSSAALVRVLKSTFSQSRASAAAAGKASPGPAAAAPPAARLNSSSSSSSSDGRGGSSSSQGLAPVASAPAAAPSPLRSILRRPSNVSSTSRQSSIRAADAARHTQTSLSALDHPPQQQQQQVLLLASHSSRPSMTSGAGSPFAALPPLPRPASSHSLEAAAAAAAAASPGGVGPFLGGSSSSISMLPQPLASEGPFAAPHALPSELMPAGSSLQPGSSSAGLSTAQHSMQQQGSVASAPLQVLREAYSTGVSSIGQLSSSGSSSGAGGSLMSLAVTRMHSAAASCSNIAAAAAAAGANGPPAKSSSMPSMGSLDTAKASSSSNSSSTAVARAFAEAFLAALAAGNTKWASEAAVGQLLHETAKMVGLDKQLYAGKTAIIRRLNGGMEQLVKMAQATAADSDGDDSAATAADGVAALARKLPKPQLSVTCPDPKVKPSQVEAVYVFKWGIRKFTMKDEFIVRDGQILRLRRSRG